MSPVDDQNVALVARCHRVPAIRHQLGLEDPLALCVWCRHMTNLVAVGVLLLVLLDEPVLDSGGGGTAGTGILLTLDLDGHALVLLERGGEVSLLGRLGGLGLLEGEDLALGVGVLDGWYLVGLELLQVEFLNEIG